MITLHDVLDAAGRDLSDVVVATDQAGSTTWAVERKVFATLSADGSTASFLLDPIVAAAAARTPDVSRSARGVGWVELNPRVVDGHVADRAAAWLLSGHRRLTGPGA